jgi:transcriptional regulator with XRE-family HTH domain
VATRTRSIDAARLRWARTRVDIGDQLRASRLALGLPMRQLAAAIGVSTSEISRRERGEAPRINGEKLSVHAAAVGLKLAVSLWPVGGGIRDAAQARYIAAFVARVGRPWRVVLEAPVRISGDLRAADVVLSRGDIRLVVEVMTRLADLQAQVRAAQLKARDLGATRLIVVVAATHANRRALAEARPAVLDAFDLVTRRVMAELAAGRDPGRDAIVMLDLGRRSA